MSNEKVKQAINLLNESGVPYILACQANKAASQVVMGEKRCIENIAAVFAQAALNGKENGLDRYKAEVKMNKLVRWAIKSVYEEGE